MEFNSKLHGDFVGEKDSQGTHGDRSRNAEAFWILFGDGTRTSDMIHAGYFI